ncbi:hypothetical protein CRM22_010555 [Opisthorchis felineus]|uniref:Uncharacterized protein n=1 Tax=Opisthorchis felineus TaxID=147828 RepID=A0A4V3SC20_OPIFE|nr:hypothetical protein CRM22_010555 [Opisthorchis felineus]
MNVPIHMGGSPKVVSYVLCNTVVLRCKYLEFDKQVFVNLARFYLTLCRNFIRLFTPWSSVCISLYAFVVVFKQLYFDLFLLITGNAHYPVNESCAGNHGVSKTAAGVAWDVRKSVVFDAREDVVTAHVGSEMCRHGNWYYRIHTFAQVG